MADEQKQSATVVPLVISASRRTDLVCCYPELLIEKLASYPPEKVHSLVIWTKNPLNMIRHAPLRAALAGYRQLYVHLSITGLGGSVLEPRIPAWREVAALLPAVVELAGDPRRVSWRFDPIVRAVMEGKETANFELFPLIAGPVGACGITTCRTSWVEPYRKVVRRMEKKGVRLLPYSIEERREQASRLQQWAAQAGMTVHFCSMEGFARSRCIDGHILEALHPDGMPCSKKKAKGQRALCGCTESLDIGWYSLKCTNGCLYCYAEPLVE